MKTFMKTLIKYVSSLLSAKSGFDYRMLLVSVILAYFIVIVFIGRLACGDYAPLWRAAGVKVMKPPFADLRAITSGLDCYRKGIRNVISFNPCDPWHRPTNHPRIWFLLLGPSGISEKDTELLGTLLAVLFILSTLAFVKRLNFTEAIIYCLTICSPAVMLAVERGNSDIVIFLLLCLVIAMSKRTGILPNLISRAVLLFAAFLKLYPIFSLIYYIKEKPKAFIITVGSLIALFLLYVMYYFEDMVTLWRVTPRNYRSSYGAFVYADFLIAALKRAGVSLNSTVFHAIMWGIAAAILAACGYVSMKKAPLELFDSTHINGFQIGAGIFVGTFLIGNNFDYRLIFLILTMPQLITWGKHTGTLGYLSIMALTLLLMRYWGEWWTAFLFPHSLIPIKYALKQLTEWLLFAFYSYALIETIRHRLLKFRALEAQRNA
jgi:hypothetical protein